MRIRQAKVEDVDAIIPLLNAVSDLHGKNRADIFLEHPRHIGYEKLISIIENNNHIVLVAESQSVIVGVMLCSLKTRQDDIKYQNAKLMSIEDTYVAPEYRGLNCASSLLEQALRIALSYGCDRVESTVWSFNERSLSWLKKNGFSLQRSIVELKLNPNDIPTNFDQ